MSITTFATLKTAVADYLARSDLTSYIPYFVQGAESRLNKLRLRHMETQLTTANPDPTPDDPYVTISNGVIALPADYLEMKHLQVASNGRRYALMRRTLEQLYQNYPTRSASGLPREYAREGSNIIFGPYPDSNYQIYGTYYAKPAALSADGDTNWWIDNNPLAFLYACLLEAEPFLKNDARIQVWAGLLQKAIDDIKAEEIEELISGGGSQETLG